MRTTQTPVYCSKDTNELGELVDIVGSASRRKPVVSQVLDLAPIKL
jgi:hypothetical protein